MIAGLGHRKSNCVGTARVPVCPFVERFKAARDVRRRHAVDTQHRGDDRVGKSQSRAAFKGVSGWRWEIRAGQGRRVLYRQCNGSPVRSARAVPKRPSPSVPSLIVPVNVASMIVADADAQVPIATANAAADKSVLILISLCPTRSQSRASHPPLTPLIRQWGNYPDFS
jgi:hypothetical protein